MKTKYIILISLLSLFSSLFAQKEIQLYKNYYLAQEDTLEVNTHIKIYVGDAFIAGVLNGNLTLYGGNVELEKTAEINGSIVCYGGKVTSEDDAKVEKNNIFVRNLKGVDVKTSMKNWIKDTRTITVEFDDRHKAHYQNIFRTPDNIPHFESTVDFNRQDGFYIQYGDYFNRLGTLKNATLGVKAGYGFQSKLPQGAVQLRNTFFSKNPLTVYGLIYHEHQTLDNWRLNIRDNSLLFLFSKYDHYDRFTAEGFKGGAQWRFLNILTIKGEYISQTEDTLGINYEPENLKRYDLSFSQQDFGLNTGIKVSAIINLGHDGESFPGAFQLSAVYEDYSASYGGEFDFQRAMIEGSYIGTLFEAFQLRTRFISAAVKGDIIPDRYTYRVGGMGSIRGLDFKSIHGSKMFILTQELGVTFDDDFYVFSFMDFGTAKANNTENSIVDELYDFSQNDFSSTIGFGIETGGLDEFGFRLDWARDAVDTKAPWITYFRISRMF